MYYCFGCGAGGNVFTFLMEYENYSFVEALKYLADRAGVELPEPEYSGEAKKRADTKAILLEINKAAAQYFYVQLLRPQGGHALTYLKDRKLSDDTIKAFGLGYSNKYSDDLYKYLKSKGYKDDMISQAGLISIDEKYGVHDKFWNRVMFPIMDVNSRVIGFGGRVMGDAKPKYLNSPETIIFDKSRNLYGLNRARKSRKPYFLLCEGYMDGVDAVICCDAGMRHARKLGIVPDYIVGDFDSASAEVLEYYKAKNIPIRQFPTRKNETDMELGIILALELGATDLVLFGGIGDRFDHTLANAHYLLSLLKKGVRARLVDDKNCVEVIDQHLTLHGKVGDLVSTLPLSMEVTGITLKVFS